MRIRWVQPRQRGSRCSGQTDGRRKHSFRRREEHSFRRREETFRSAARGNMPFGGERTHSFRRREETFLSAARGNIPFARGERKHSVRPRRPQPRTYGVVQRPPNDAHFRRLALGGLSPGWDPPPPGRLACRAAGRGGSSDPCARQCSYHTTSATAWQWRVPRCPAPHTPRRSHRRCSARRSPLLSHSSARAASTTSRACTGLRGRAEQSTRGRAGQGGEVRQMRCVRVDTAPPLHPPLARRSVRRAPAAASLAEMLLEVSGQPDPPLAAPRQAAPPACTGARQRC